MKAPVTVTVYDVQVTPRQVEVPASCPHCNAGPNDGRTGTLVLHAEVAQIESPLGRRGSYVQQIRCGECRWELAWANVEAPPSVQEIAEDWVEGGLDESLSVDRTVEAMRRWAGDPRPRDAEHRLDGQLVPVGMDVGAVEDEIRRMWPSFPERRDPRTLPHDYRAHPVAFRPCLDCGLPAGAEVHRPDVSSTGDGS